MKKEHLPNPSYTMIGLVMLVFFVISFITNILNPILSEVKSSFGLSLTAVAFLPFSFFIAYGVMSVPAGFLAAKYREKPILSYSFLIIFAASLLFTFIPVYGVFLLSLFITGCCMALLQVVINPLLRTAGGESNFAFNSVMAQLVFGLASFVSPFVYSALAGMSANPFFEKLRAAVPEDLPWVALYFIFAATSLLLFIIIRLLRFPETQHQGEETSGTPEQFRILLRSRTTWFYFFGIFAYVGVEQGIGNWISPFLEAYHDIDPKTLGVGVVARFWGMMTLGCLLGLLLLKFMDSRILLRITTMLAAISLLTALTGSSQMAVTGFTACGFFISVMWSVLFALGLNSVPQYHGALSGILCTGIAGGAIFPLLTGWAGEIAGLKAGMFLLFLPLSYIFYIALKARPLITNKTISLKKSS